jgi:hypothetical protein
MTSKQSFELLRKGLRTGDYEPAPRHLHSGRHAQQRAV